MNAQEKENTIESIQIADAPAIPGLTFRGFQGESDYPKMVALSNLCNQRDGVDEIETVEEMAHNYQHLRNCDPYQDMLFAEVNGEVIAYSRMYWHEEYESGEYMYKYFVNLHPDWRGKGIHEAMLSYIEKHLADKAAEHPTEAAKYYETWSKADLQSVVQVYEGHGYEPVRYFFQMLRPLDEPIPDLPMPEGLEVRPAQPDKYRQIFDALNEAFRDHWGHVESTEEDYKRYIESPTSQPELWKVAWDGDQVAGMVINGIFPEENKALNIKRGWTDPICVLRPWRKRGLAKALIAQSLQLFKDMGFEQAALDVDTMNPSGALKLYESMGYHQTQKWVSYRKAFSLNGVEKNDNPSRYDF